MIKGVIAYEVITGLPPYYDVAHEEFLAIRICQGLRSKSNYKVPQLISDIIELCWDEDPLKRPKAEELYDLLRDLKDAYLNESSLIYKQINEADGINEQLPSSPSTGRLSYTTHPQAVYKSRVLNFKNLPESKNADELYSGKLDSF